VVCLAPRAPGDRVHPRRSSGVVVRPLNFTVRRTAMSRPLNRSSMSLVAAALLGIAQMYLLTILWGYISAYTPLPRWLLTLGLKGTAFHAVVFLSDSLLNVIFCLPAAYGICRLRPPRLPVYLILAIVPGFPYSNTGRCLYPEYCLLSCHCHLRRCYYVACSITVRLTIVGGVRDA